MIRSSAGLAVGPLLVATLAGGCRPPPPEPTPPATRPEADASPLAQEWWAAPRPCPEGATLRGSAYPRSRRVWCELPGGVPHGRLTAWFKNGTRRTEGVYDEGKMHGPWISWHENARVRTRGTYEMGVMAGTWTSWYESGRIATRTEHDAATNNTHFVEWFKTGNKSREGDYHDGQEHGVWVEWDAEGKQTRRTVWNQGNLVEDSNRPERVGIAICDRFLDDYRACVRTHFDPEGQARAHKAIVDLITSWKQTQGAAGDEATTAACLATKATVSEKMATLGCRFDDPAAADPAAKPAESGE